MALTKLTSNLIEGGTGTDWVTAIQTSNFTAEAGKGYFVNTTSQVLYVNLPVGVVGMEITIQDYAGTFATNKVILNANGSEKIQGSAYEGQITTNNATAVLIYQDATKGWTSQDVGLVPQTVSVDYLVVAGGAAAGAWGGGGGAGGLRTSYGSTTGGGGSAETTLSITPSTSYSVTVGAGGAAQARSATRLAAVSGSNSVFANVISTGGGGGGVGVNTTTSISPSTGGSGGGGGLTRESLSPGAAAVTSPVTQGYAGGLNPNSDPYPGGGGGGGAGAVGGNGLANGSAGNGGNGLSNSITGSAVTYAGGGAGMIYGIYGASLATGGTGGGGDGARFVSSSNGSTGGQSNGGNGTDNLGGGGGAGALHQELYMAGILEAEGLE